MATKKDLVEAHSFSRRRLVTAFVSGAPGGREVEPVRPGRVLIGGLALSVLLMAGAAVAGFLLGRPPAQWLETGSFIISKDTGEQYVVLRGGDDAMIQRVPNYVSAQLLLGKAELTPATVRDKYIRTVRLGDDLGIEGAPASLPAAERLVDDGWTACTADGVGIKVAIQQQPTVADLTSAAFLVDSGDAQWLLAPAHSVGSETGRTYRFAMPRNQEMASTLANRLGFGASAPEVSEEWLNLFPLGPPLEVDQFAVKNVGKPVGYRSERTDLSPYSIGDLLQSRSGDYYLLADEGLQGLADFPGLVYDIVGKQAIELDDDPGAAFADPGHPTEWPHEVPEAVDGGAMCGVLHPGAGSAPTVTLATEPTGPADPAKISLDRHAVYVEPSTGAYVLSGSAEAAASGTPYVIDTKGQKYALNGIAVPDYIGYGTVKPPLVPSTWLEFFTTGVALSTNSARRIPEDAPAPSDEAGAGS